ncbi:MAG: hypothetical protein P4M12_00890 [Gammaproteobacteria bacterium]|nr:hypothetical protein [Gammaproteobacteria bacterium]
MKSVTSLFRWNDMALLLLYAVIALLLLAPIASNTSIPNVIDYFTHMAGIVQANVALSAGQFPLRTAPLSHQGWYYPLFQFYSTTAYTFSGLIYHWFTANNPFMAYKISLWCALIFGGIYMFKLAYEVVGSRASAVLASIIYLTAPYNIILIDHIGALNEALAIGILPAVIFYTLKLYHPNNSYLLYSITAVCWYVLITVHLLTFIFSSLFVGLFLVLMTVLQQQKFGNLLRVGIAYIFAILLACWYLMPIVLLQKILVISGTFSDTTAFNIYTPTFSQLFSPYADISAGVMSPNGFINLISQIHLSVGLPILLGFGVCLYAVFKNKFVASEKYNQYVLSLLITFIIAFMLVWSPLDFWHSLPNILMVIQYSWRLLGQVMWLGSLLCAGALCWVFQKDFKLKYILCGMVIIFFSSITWLLPARDTINEISTAKLNDLPKILDDGFNIEAYLIDIKKNSSLISLIDNVSIFQGMPGEPLGFRTINFNANYFIPAALINLANSPYLIVQGGDTNKAISSNDKMWALINGDIVSTYYLKPGLFTWKIPLEQFKNVNNKLPLHLQFKTNQKNVVALKKISLEGFLKSQDVITLKNSVSNCIRVRDKSICHIQVPASVRLIELPLLYYPQMLHITVNGKEVSYYGVLNEGSLIVGIVPEAGKTNIIEFQFRGLLWANYISVTAWGMLFLLLMYFILKHIFYSHSLSQEYRV